MRNTLCFGKTVILSGALAVLPLGAARAYADMGPWSQYQGDALHDGYVAGDINPAGINRLWSVSAGGLNVLDVVPGAATDGQHVYISALVGPASDGFSNYDVFALETATGSVAWSQPFAPYSPYGLSQPSTGNGMVYVDGYGEAGGIAADDPFVEGLNAGTGQPVFETTHSGQWTAGSRPVVSGSQVFAAGGEYGGLDGYDAQTGAHQWFAGVNQQYGWIPAADSTDVYVYMGSAGASPGPGVGTFYAVNRTTGALDYSIQNPNDNYAYTYYNGTVFLGQNHDAITRANGVHGNELISFDLASHGIAWQAFGNYTGSVAIHNGIVYADNGVELSLLNEATGATTKNWIAPAGTSLTGNLLVTDNLIFAQTTDQSGNPETYAIDPSTMTAVWSVANGGDLALGSNLLLISNSSSLTAYAVPVPASLSLLGLGLGTTILLLRRRMTG